jgi:iron complex transport system substrate-binding protein
MKICSLLPSATEIACALGLEEELVAVTHECDYPAAMAGKPRITRNAMDHGDGASAEIHRHISGALHRGSSIYYLDQELLERLAPDIILTQELCDVCAVSYQQVQRAVRIAESDASIVSLEPRTLEEILETIVQVGELTGRQEQAETVVGGLRERIDRVTAAVAGAQDRPRVLCVEWLDPVMVGGHWVPGMVEMAGGGDGLGRTGEPSFTVTWRQVADYQPEVVVLMPCGFHLQQTVAEVKRTTLPAEWAGLPAVRQGRVFAVDGSSYFNRPGPRIVDGLELLAQIIHPSLAPGLHGPSDLCRMET